MLFLFGKYIAILSWIVMGTLLIKHLFLRNYFQLKISLLYLFNSSTFILAWAMILSLAMIVIPPLGPNKEVSIQLLQTAANEYRIDYLLSSALVVIVFSLINYFSLTRMKVKHWIRHLIILFLSDAIILIAASFLAADRYFKGLMTEIERHF